jgi:ribA/ribD-fused uncharacterized protein
MDWEWNNTKHANCAVIFKVKEEWGELSNMNNDFPLRVNGIYVGSSEALYQAMRYPHQPDWQKEILDAPHAMMAKMKSKKGGRRKTGSRPDWEAVQLDIMRWCLRVKLAFHFREFGRILRASNKRAIVERSRKDRYWGAVAEDDAVLRGENWLGRLLMELRDEVAAHTAPGLEPQFLHVPAPTVPDMRLLGVEIGTVEGRK